MPTKVPEVKTVDSDAPGAYGDPNLFKFARLPVVLTADLPAASAAMNGRIFIEQATGSDRNLVFYAGGERHRIDGAGNV
jgi:hypothetical protein